MPGESRIEARPHGGVRLVPARLIDSDLLNRIHAHKADLIAHIRAAEEKAEIDRSARADGWRPLPEPGHPAYSIVATCQGYGVALGIDTVSGDLVVGKPGAKWSEPSQPWRSLVIAIEAHVEAVADLVEAGWTLNARFPENLSA